jgi:hypothetical protein
MPASSPGVHESIFDCPACDREGFTGPDQDCGMGNEFDEIRELHSTLRGIGHYPQLLRSMTELRDEAASKGDSNMAALWNWLARQVVEVRDDDGRVLQFAARDFTPPAMGEN